MSFPRYDAVSGVSRKSEHKKLPTILRIAIIEKGFPLSNALSKFRSIYLVWSIAALALTNAITSLVGNRDNVLPSSEYLVGKFILFCAMVGAIWALGRPAHGQGIKAERPDALLTLRAFACALVLIGHYFIVEFAPTDQPQLFIEYPFTRLLASSPWGGVWLFFVLSGYLMGKGFYTGRYNISSAGLSAYFRNRALRILPVYAVAILICSFLISPAIFQRQNWWVFSQYAIFDFKGIDPAVPNGAAWSISTEVQFYFLAPFLAYFLQRLRARQALLLIAIYPLVMLAVFVFTHAHWHDWMYTPMLSNGAIFCSGIAANNLVEAIKARPILLSRTRATAFGLGLLASYYVAISLYTSYTMAIGIAGGYMKLAPILTGWVAIAAILLFECGQGTLAPALAKFVRSSEIFGALAYCIYLVQEPTLRISRSFLPVNISLTESLALIVPVNIAILTIAYLLYRGVEKQFDRLRSGHERLKDAAFGVAKY